MTFAWAFVDCTGQAVSTPAVWAARSSVYIARPVACSVALSWGVGDADHRIDGACGELAHADASLRSRVGPRVLAS